MKETRVTLGIYGIQDRLNTKYPQYVHDHNLACIQNGRVERFLQLERFTRRKRDNKLHEYLPQLIRSMKMVDADIDVVFVDNVVGRAFIATSGQIRFEAPIATRLTKDWEKGRLWWFNRELDGYVLNHELAHIFSCLPFYGDFKENSLLIHFDGGASFSGFSAWMYRRGQIIPVEHHWGLKHLTKLFNANALTFGIMGAKMEDQNSVPGKMMGYAAFGNYNEDIEFWLRENNWFENIWGNRSVFFEKVKADFDLDIHSFDLHNTFLQDIVATIQSVFMRETLMKIDDVNSLCNCRYLYYTGGSALNLQTNSALVESKLFDDVFIPPCTEDSGLSLGAAAFGEWKKGHSFQTHSPYLNNVGISDAVVEYTADDIVKVANMLADGKVIGICNGFGEAGPRALGNRSLLALPTKALAHKVSVIHKKREWYRPVAPVMLEKNALYFTNKKEIHHLTRHMLLDVAIDEDRQSEIGGVVHADGTARIQVLFSQVDNPFLFDLLTCLDAQYGIKALINTSFNSKGKPIVHSCYDAIESARLMKIDGMVINGKLTAINK